MELLADISNVSRERRPAAKTFERRRRALTGANAQDPTSPASSCCTPSTPGSSSSAYTEPLLSAASRRSDADSARQQQGDGSSLALRVGWQQRRRSSILVAAALPGHANCREAPASRSALLQRMSKAKRRAYLAFTQRMASHFAEVDEFELAEESPGRPDTEQKQRAAQQEQPGTCPDVAHAAAGRNRSSSSSRHSALASLTPAGSDASLVARLQLAAATPGVPLVAETPAASAAAAAGGGGEDVSYSPSEQAALALLACPPHSVAHPSPGSPAAAAAATGPCSLASHTPGSVLLATSSSTAAGDAAAPAAADAARDTQQQQLPAAASPPCSPVTQQLPGLLACTPLSSSSSVAVAADELLPELPEQLQRLLLADTLLAASTPLSSSSSGSHQQRQRASSLAAATPTPAQQQQQSCGQRQRQSQQDDVQAAADQVEQQLQQVAAQEAAQQLAALQLVADAEAQLSPLQRMLKACGQPTDVACIPSMKAFIEEVADLRQVVKLGEGTYGEAFRANGAVFKLVPMEGTNLINGWPQKGAGDLLAEATIARALSGLADEADAATGAPHASHTGAFVRTYRVGVARGPYAAPLVRAWKAWDARHGSENDPVGGLPRGQLYAVFGMAHCGQDLEGWVLRDYEQARSMMLQVALALAVAEEALAFEHRDLHWGNVMLRAVPADATVRCRLQGSAIAVRAEGAEVSLIDFTASRLQTPGGDVAFCDLEGEEGLFDGPAGKPQFEAYRHMRALTGGDWAGSHPATNVVWLRYLAELLLSSDKPVPKASAAQKRALRAFAKRAGGYACAGDAIWDELFAGLWTVEGSDA